MRGVLVALAALACTAAPCAVMAAQQSGYSVTGTVVDAATGAPLAGARVRLQLTAFAALTNAAGTFVLPRGGESDTLIVTRIGYATTHQLVRGAMGHVTVRLAPAAVALPELVSIASRRDQRSSDVVVPVTTLTRDEISRSGALSVDQLLGELPGVQQSSTPPAGSTLTIRGISGSRVLLLVDGEPASGRHLEDRDVSRLSTSGLERVEIVKGPLAVMHGSQALGGVINLVSQAPIGPLAFDVDGGTGSSGRRTAALGAQAGGTVPWRLSGAFREQHQLGGQVARDGALSRVWDGRGTVRHAMGSIAVRADASWFRERQRWPSGGGLFGFNDNRGVSAWGEASIGTSGGTTGIRVAGQDFTHRFREAAGEIPYENTGAPTQHERTYRAVVTHARPIGRLHHLDAGVEFAWARVVAADRLIGERLSEHTAALYAQDVVTTGRVMTTIGLRHTRGSRWGGTTTPSIGVAFEPVTAVRLRAGAARGFRSPSFKELGWNFTNPGAGYVIEGNSALRPESGWQYFGGATWAAGAGVTLDVDAYRNDLRDMIETGFVGLNDAGMAVYSPRNVSRVTTRGFDVAIRGSWTSTSAGLTYGYLHTRDGERGGPLGQRSPHAVRGTLDRSVGPLRLGVVARHTAAAPIIDAEGTTTGEQGALTAVDANLSVVVSGRGVLNAGVDNLFDARPGGWQAPIRRSVWIGLRATLRP